LDLLRNDLSTRGKLAGGLLAISPQESEIRKKKKEKKGPVINVSDITLVLVPKAPNGWVVDLEESSNSTIKRGNTQTRGIHSNRSTQDTKESTIKES